MNEQLKEFLDSKVTEYNRPDFIKDDPIQIPYRFTKKQDIEITAFWTACLSWGQRKTIINKATELFTMMDNAPHDFLVNHVDTDLKVFESFKHRTFNATDTLYFIHFLKTHYQRSDSLETAFSDHINPTDDNVKNGLIGFHNLFFSLPDSPNRTTKHVATPDRKSACKRINMFLRWMVRQDECGVDFGIWNTIKPSQLVCPLDVHVERIARRHNLLTRKQSDWRAATQLTDELKKFDPNDPVKYDFALFGVGLEDKH
jgi:uncharacterized protein (TIGR02757 family)